MNLILPSVSTHDLCRKFKFQPCWYVILQTRRQRLTSMQRENPDGSLPFKLMNNCEYNFYFISRLTSDYLYPTARTMNKYSLHNNQRPALFPYNMRDRSIVLNTMDEHYSLCIHYHS